VGTASARYVAKMEDVLSVYERPYDAKHPVVCVVVCVDEGRKELRSTPKGDLPATPKGDAPAGAGQVKREDYEYEREGAANLFLAVEPLAGRRFVAVTDRRTGVDFAHFLKRVSDEFCADAETIVLVLDNLNTHKPWSLYSAFDPAEACRLMKRFEFHYTPEHGSWLNVAEIELSVMQRQCLNRRIGRENIVPEVSAWEIARNELQGKVNWHFTTQDARVKLRRLYPEWRKEPAANV